MLGENLLPSTVDGEELNDGFGDFHPESETSWEAPDVLPAETAVLNQVAWPGYEVPEPLDLEPSLTGQRNRPGIRQLAIGLMLAAAISGCGAGEAGDGSGIDKPQLSLEDVSHIPSTTQTTLRARTAEKSTQATRTTFDPRLAYVRRTNGIPFDPTCGAGGMPRAVC
jgi:hypothetical protein